MAIDASILNELEEWLNLAAAHTEIYEPTAMALATVNEQGRPACRIVLLKQLDEQGLVFFTNMESAKSRALAINPFAALTFYWMPLKRQIRVEGLIEHVSDEEADRYFAQRARTSQIGAWASSQSEILDSRETFEKRIAAIEDRFHGKEVPRPPHWSGWRVLPSRIEFWIERDFRLHDRWEYRRDENGGWQRHLLYP